MRVASLLGGKAGEDGGPMILFVLGGILFVLLVEPGYRQISMSGMRNVQVHGRCVQVSRRRGPPHLPISSRRARRSRGR